MTGWIYWQNNHIRNKDLRQSKLSAILWAITFDAFIMTSRESNRWKITWNKINGLQKSLRLKFKSKFGYFLGMNQQSIQILWMRQLETSSISSKDAGCAATPSSELLMTVFCLWIGKLWSYKYKNLKKNSRKKKIQQFDILILN